MPVCLLVGVYFRVYSYLISNFEIEMITYPAVALNIEIINIPQIPGNIVDKLFKKCGTS